jgi:ABC-type glycerol-3-phosphate transport system permease component
MNFLHLCLIFLAAIFLALWFFSRSAALKYGRFAILLLVATVMLMPFAWLVCSAFKSIDAMDRYTFLPPPSQISCDNLNLDNFRSLLEKQPTLSGPVTFWRYVANSLFLASTTTVVSLFFCSLGGYALAKYRFRGRNAVMVYMLSSMAIPAVVLLAPNFEVIWRLGWMDTYKALIIPGAVSAFGIFLFRQAMLNVPNELLEAARIDGCNEFKIYLTLIMPLVRPMSGAFCLISFMGSWNAFLPPNIFLQSQSKLPLPVILNQYMGTYVQHYGIFLAGTLLAVIPPAILFFSLQREFISGLTSGAVKQ